MYKLFFVKKMTETQVFSTIFVPEY